MAYSSRCHLTISRLIQPPDLVLERGGAADVAADDARDIVFFPRHDLGDLALAEAVDVELRGGRAAQVVEVEIGHAFRPCILLGLDEGAAEAILVPRPALARGEDDGRCAPARREDPDRAE